MAKIRKRTILLITLTICVVVGLLGQVVFVKMRDHLKKLDDEITQRTLDLEIAREEITHNKKYIEQWNAISTFRNEPVEERRTRFTAYLDSLETERNFIYDDLIPPATGKPMEANEHFQVLSYTLTFSSDLQDLVEYLDQLDRSKQLLKVDRLVVSKRKVSYFRSRFETSLPSSRNRDLTVNVTVSIPSAKEAAKTAETVKVTP